MMLLNINVSSKDFLNVVNLLVPSHEMFDFMLAQIIASS
jgi:hypothetical protein